MGVQAAAPHMQPAPLAVEPSVSKQSGRAEHLLRDDVQKRPFVVVQAAAPQMHPKLFAVVPSVSEQTGPVAQTQGSLEEQLGVELLRELK